MTGTDDIDEDLGPECPCDLCNPWAGEDDNVRQTGFIIYPPAPTLFIDYSRQPIDEYRGEVPPTPEPATDPYEMEAG